MADSGSSHERKPGVLPPPPTEREDVQQVTVPPLEPPPASLEALVHNRRRESPRPAEKNPWLLLVALFLLGMLLTMYFHR